MTHPLEKIYKVSKKILMTYMLSLFLILCWQALRTYQANPNGFEAHIHNSHISQKVMKQPSAKWLED